MSFGEGDLHKEVDRLRAEVERLQDSYDVMLMQRRRLEHQLDECKYENDALRKLVDWDSATALDATARIAGTVELENRELREANDLNQRTINVMHIENERLREAVHEMWAHYHEWAKEHSADYARRTGKLEITDEMRLRMKQLESENDDLWQENDELRELVSDMLPCYRWSNCCGACENDGGVYAPCPQRVEQRVKELGIEVDE